MSDRDRYLYSELAYTLGDTRARAVCDWSACHGRPGTALHREAIVTLCGLHDGVTLPDLIWSLVEAYMLAHMPEDTGALARAGLLFLSGSLGRVETSDASHTWHPL